MKKISFVLLGIVMILNFGLLFAGYESAGEDYTKALTVKGTKERIKAFEEYIKKYPDTNQSMFTKFAYHFLAIEYFNDKNYPAAIKNGQKFLEFKDLDKVLEAKTYLMLAGSYGVKDSPSYNKEKALVNVEKAITVARAAGDNNLVQSAEKLKKALETPEQKPTTPLQRMGVAFQNNKFDEVISIYKSLPPKDQENEDIFKVYAAALLKAQKIDLAIREFSEMYTKKPNGLNASRLAQIYLNKAERDRSYTDKAIQTLIEASILFSKEKDTNRAKLMIDNARYQFYEKFQFNKKIQAYNVKVQEESKKQQANQNIQEEVKKLEREYQRIELEIERKYQDIEAPAYEYERLEKIKKKIDELKKSGGSGKLSEALEKEGKALEEERKKIDVDFQKLVDETRKKLS